MSIIVCVNAIENVIPNSYVFKDRQRRRNYITRCEDRAVIGTQD